MKLKRYVLLPLMIIIMAMSLKAQQKMYLGKGISIDSLPVIYLDDRVSIHFISPEPIQYVDISSKRIAGDLPVKNILRIRYISNPEKDWAKALDTGGDAVITVVGEKFIAQYKVVHISEEQQVLGKIEIKTNIEITPSDSHAIDVPLITMSQREMQAYANKMVQRRPRIFSVGSSAYNLKTNLNNIYSIGDYIFLDVSVENHTNLKYDIDEVRFKINDKKIEKATNVQSIEISPEYIFNNAPSFKKTFRGIYVFKKFTFPGNKVLSIEMTEKQISGRLIKIVVDYQDLLNADTLN
ncbi:conjugative transposon protein TraN [Mucilaginibacter lappiensis]|uniref:Conjugative transposon TraN protein n=1 Tax=Mucilaginibacter lappiensis TaxID=354630 RepID=A0A841JTA0_9SPHI|nr:conjugative transposon protein TraN [Mucilaginibacter lappiensis]MBB6131505.1 conjugative transposon TraN protein [Mucilaginibacter lappiensis]